MKSKTNLLILFLAILTLFSCSTKKYTDGQNIISYIMQRGKIQNNGQYWLDLGFSDKSDTKNYALYNPRSRKIGVAYVYENTLWSETANKLIVSDYTEEYGFFEPGKPWEATYYFYNYHVDYETLEKKRTIATFDVSKKAFDTKTYKMMSYSENEFLINLNVTDGNSSKFDKYYALNCLKKTFDYCSTWNIIRDMPYLF